MNGPRNRGYLNDPEVLELSTDTNKGEKKNSAHENLGGQRFLGNGSPTDQEPEAKRS